jgi:hypothetical protein
MRRHAVLLVSFAALALAACQAGAPTAATVEMPARAADFAFTFEFSVCYREVLDTFDGTYTRQIAGEPDVHGPMVLNAEQMQAVYDKLVAIDFWSYPAEYRVPAAEVVAVVSPYYRYALTVRNDGTTHAVAWTDDIVDPAPLEAVRLRELFTSLVRMVKATPEFQALPSASIGCI